MSSAIDRRAGRTGKFAWHSIRWRLPVLVSGVLTLALSVSVAFGYWAIRSTLIQAGSQRADAAAKQVAGFVAPGLQRSTEDMRRAVADPVLRRSLQDPTPVTLEAARSRLMALATPGPRRIELWDRSGVLRLSIDTPAAAADGRAPVVLPAGRLPGFLGFGNLQVVHDLLVTDHVGAVAIDPSEGAPAPSQILGFLVRRSTFSVNPPGIVQRLIGADARVALGSRERGVWTDLVGVVPTPQIDLNRFGPSTHQQPDGEVGLGALEPIAATDWAVWVEFPRAGILAPADRFLLRTGSLALLSVVVVAAIIVAWISGRITRPLSEMSTAADDIAGGDYGRRVHTTRLDEIGLLGDAFDTMAVQIETAYSVLKQHEEHTQFALTAARMGVWEVDLRKHQITWSEGLASIVGVAAEDAATTLQEFFGHIHPDDRELVKSSFERAIGGGDSYHLEFRALRPDGSVVWLDSRARLLLDAHGAPTHVLGIAMDVNERQALETQLRQAQKMDAIGQLAGGVAHDFNNLLTAIVGYGSLLAEEMTPEDPARDDVGEILKAAESAAGLTRQLLALSRRQVLQPAVVVLNAVIVNAESLLRRLIREDIALRTRLQPDLHTIRVDPVQLEQVLINLVVNARDAMPDGGTVTIETANIDLDEAYAREHPTVQAGQYVQLSVTDTGTGMNAETQKRLFEPFFTTKPKGQGTGLGLATAYGIVKQSGGHIYVYSEPGLGATFKIYLPVVNEQGVTRSVKIVTPHIVRGSETILLVEDNEPARALATRVLERAGYRVLVAVSGEHAVAVLNAATDRVDLLITDVILPGMSGAVLAARLKAASQELRVLFTSGYSDEAIVRHGVLEPGTLFLQKPYTPSALTRTVRQALE